MGNYERPKTIFEKAKEFVTGACGKIGDMAMQGVDGIVNAVNPQTRESRWRQLMQNK